MIMSNNVVEARKWQRRVHPPPKIVLTVVSFGLGDWDAVSFYSMQTGTKENQFVRCWKGQAIESEVKYSSFTLIMCYIIPELC